MAIQHQNSIIQAMFNPEIFRTEGHNLIDILADLLSKQLAGTGMALNWQAPKLAEANWQAALPILPTLNINQLLQHIQHDILANNLAVHHPHNMGHQVATPLPIAALCDLVAALTNQAMAVYEAGPSATLLERQVIRWLCDLIGWKNAEGVLTSGGAQANLTALLAARQNAAASCWQEGVAAQKPLKILASEHSHYSISRAAGIMGLGANAVIKVPCNSLGQMLTAELKIRHEQCVAQGEIVIAVVANAGCTATGSIDPLEAIGTYCKAHQLWFHIDGAHGASTLLSEKHRHLVGGIALADSVVWDGHKLLYMPATVSAVLFKEPKNSFAAFAQQASYLFQNDDVDEAIFNVSYRTLECTKRMMALKLWAVFSLYGTQGLAALIDEAFAKAKLLAQMINRHNQFQLYAAPETNIVCFRHVVISKNLNQHQANIRNHLVQSGQFHITQVELHGEIWLRTTLMNPFTQASHLQALLDAICNQIVSNNEP